MPPTPEEVIMAGSAYVNALKAEVETLKSQLAEERNKNLRSVMGGPHDEGFA